MFTHVKKSWDFFAEIKTLRSLAGVKAQRRYEAGSTNVFEVSPKGMRLWTVGPHATVLPRVIVSLKRRSPYRGEHEIRLAFP